MFNGPDFPASLEEKLFTEWIEAGKQHKLGYQYLLIVWDAYDSIYRPVYVQQREELGSYERYASSPTRESLVAAYDLYSESRII